MIYFPRLNSLKFVEYSGLSLDEVEDYVNTLYPNLSKGINQKFENTDEVSGVIFRSNESIVIQMILDVADDANNYNISISSSDGVVSLGSISVPTGGSSSIKVLDNGTHAFWNVTIPTSNGSCYGFINVINNTLALEFNSEVFYLSDENTTNNLSHNIMAIKYKNENGIEKDYYWTEGDYQEIKVDLAYYSRVEFETDSESAEGEDSTVLLESDTRMVQDRTLANIPTYLYEKIAKASYCTDIYLNNKAVVCTDISSPNNQKDGLSTVTFTYKEKETDNLY